MSSGSTPLEKSQNIFFVANSQVCRSKSLLTLDRFSRFRGIFGAFLPEIQPTNKKRMTEYGKYVVRGHFLFGKQ